MLIYCEKCHKVIGEAIPTAAETFLKSHDQEAHQVKVPESWEEEMLDKVKPITEVVPAEALRPNLITTEEVLGKEIIVTDLTYRDSSFHEDQQYLSLNIILNKQSYILNTGAQRIISAFEFLSKDNLPISMTLEKVKLATGKRVYRIKID